MRCLREVAVEQLEQAPEEEVWLIADNSDLRKPYAEAMPYLMQVPDLEGELVPGYRTINVPGVTPGRRGLLYHHLFSSRTPDFVSEPAEVQEALEKVSQALTPLKDRKTITWLLDSGFDDAAVWRTIWQAREHLVCRVYHLERLVSFQDRTGQWQESNLGQARGQMQLLARVQTTLVAKRGTQPRAKKQQAEVEIAACPVRPTLLLTFTTF
jgi:hypothetical protein